MSMENSKENTKFRRINSPDDALNKVIRATKKRQKKFPWFQLCSQGVTRLKFLAKNHVIAAFLKWEST